MHIVCLPKSVALELTYNCNHCCKFCSCPWYAPNTTYQKGKELTVTEWKMAIDMLYSKGVESFSISGGEVLLKEGFEDILRFIREEGEQRGLNKPIIIISNGLAMREEYMFLFKKLNVHLSMSLPGYETFHDHTGVDNAEGVLHWFEVAKNYGIEATLNVTVTKKNYHELFETISQDLYNDEEFIVRSLAEKESCVILGRTGFHIFRDNPNAFKVQNANRYGNVGTEIPICAIKDVEKYKRIHIGYQCAAAKGFFVVDPSGKIRTCNHSPRVVGHIFEKPMISDADYWNMFATSDYMPESCKGCKLSKMCDCGCREVANILCGSPKKKDISILA